MFSLDPVKNYMEYIFYFADPQKPKISTPDKPTSIKPKDYRPVNAAVGDNVTALTNTPISIDCPASGIPKPTITWRKGDQELSSESGYLIHDNGTLVIEVASAGDRGRYTCVAKNIEGEDRKTSSVDVIGEIYFFNIYKHF
jgi:hemicentin